jgi:hypothetical protein
MCPEIFKCFPTTARFFLVHLQPPYIDQYYTNAILELAEKGIIILVKIIVSKKEREKPSCRVGTRNNRNRDLFLSSCGSGYDSILDQDTCNIS